MYGFREGFLFQIIERQSRINTDIFTRNQPHVQSSVWNMSIVEHVIRDFRNKYNKFLYVICHQNQGKIIHFWIIITHQNLYFTQENTSHSQPRTAIDVSTNWMLLFQFISKPNRVRECVVSFSMMIMI